MNQIAIAVLAAGAIVAGAVIFASGRSIPLPHLFEAHHLSLARERLMFPESAEFRDVVRHRLIPTIWCGRIRGRNALGGMSPWQVFNVVGEDVFLEPVAKMDCE